MIFMANDDVSKEGRHLVVRNSDDCVILGRLSYIDTESGFVSQIVDTEGETYKRHGQLENVRVVGWERHAFASVQMYVVEYKGLVWSREKLPFSHKCSETCKVEMV